MPFETGGNCSENLANGRLSTLEPILMALNLGFPSIDGGEGQAIQFEQHPIQRKRRDRTENGPACGDISRLSGNFFIAA